MHIPLSIVDKDFKSGFYKRGKIAPLNSLPSFKIIKFSFDQIISSTKSRLIKNIFITQLPFKNNFCTRKKYLRSIYGLVWLKLCWGKDMDHEIMENFGNTKQNSMLDAAK